jgi:hypothetical protein
MSFAGSKAELDICARASERARGQPLPGESMSGGRDSYRTSKAVDEKYKDRSQITLYTEED